MDAICHFSKADLVTVAVLAILLFSLLEALCDGGVCGIKERSQYKLKDFSFRFGGSSCKNVLSAL